MLKFSMPLISGRGAGLGNELVVWSKAYIGSQVTGAKLLQPAWGLNKRRYWRLFETSRLDFIGHAALRQSMPFFEFKEEDLRRMPNVRFEDAIRAFVERHKLLDRRAYVIGFSGLWGGMSMIASARDFVRATLLNAKHTLPNLFKVEQRIERGKVKIGLHVRRGDFGEPGDISAIRGKFNVAIPLEWYVNCCVNLYSRLGDSAIFVIVSDAEPELLRPLTDILPCVTTHSETDTDISDLLLLSSCDFILCSVSTYSVWAAFLSEGLYGWFAPNLVQHDGFLSIWGNEPEQLLPNSETSQARLNVKDSIERGIGSKPRGVPIGLEGLIPNSVIDNLLCTKSWRDTSADLIQYGTVQPEPSTSV